MTQYLKGLCMFKFSKLLLVVFCISSSKIIFTAAPDERGNTPLHIAAKAGNVKEVIALINRFDVDIDVQNISGQTPLSCAISSASSLENCKGGDSRLRGFLCFMSRIMYRSSYVKIINALIGAGADISYECVALACTGRPEILKILIENGAKFSKDTAESPLFAASWFGSPQNIKILVDAGAKVHVQNGLGDTPLHLAVRDYRVANVKILLDAGAQVNIQNSQAQTSLHKAFFAHIDHVSHVEHKTCSHGCLQMFRVLVNAGADIASKDFFNIPLVDVIRMQSFDNSSGCMKEAGRFFDSVTPLATQLAHAISTNDIVRMRDLIDQGASLLAQDVDGNMPISYALERYGQKNLYNPHNPSVLDRLARKLIVEVGIQATLARNRDGKTLLHSAVEKNNFRMAEYLIRKGADVNAGDKYGNTPLHLASYSAMIGKLLQHRADVSIINHEGEMPIQVHINAWIPYFSGAWVR